MNKNKRRCACMDQVSSNEEKMTALVSIITPNYNCGKFIALTIESVLAQTYTNWEMIIQDDCSTDNSYEIACRYAKADSRIKVFRNDKNSGAALTRNYAIEASQGEYVAFLDSDDIWFPEKLEKQIDFMQKNNCDFVFSEYEQIGEDNRGLGVRCRVISHLSYVKMLFHTWTGCLTVMYDQQKLGKFYAPNIPNNNDRALFLKVLKIAENAQGMDECLALYRIRSKSISRNKRKMLSVFVKIINEFENKPLLFAYFCAIVHFGLKKLYKEKKVAIKDFEFCEILGKRVSEFLR